MLFTKNLLNKKQIQTIADQANANLLAQENAIMNIIKKNKIDQYIVHRDGFVVTNTWLVQSAFTSDLYARKVIEAWSNQDPIKLRINQDLRENPYEFVSDTDGDLFSFKDVVELDKWASAYNLIIDIDEDKDPEIMLITPADLTKIQNLSILSK